jgi:glycine cleavage system H protein
MVDILSEPYSLSLSPVGTQLNAGDDFGSMEGYKLSTDLISPVSGIIIEANSYLTIPVGQGGNIQDINVDPYGLGWLVIMQLTKPSELSSLLTPQQYINYVETL